MRRTMIASAMGVAMAAALMMGANGNPPKLREAHRGRKPVFWNRAAILPANGFEVFLQHLTPFRFLDDPLPFTDAQHAAFSESALVIRQTTVVDNSIFQSDPRLGATAGTWAFPQVMSLALGPSKNAESWLQGLVGNSDNFPGYALMHLNCAWQQLSPQAKPSITQFPVRLLAIVNRLDLAQMQGQVMSGAEIRFVYAALADSDLQVCGNGATLHLTMIVEFVLPDLNFPAFQQLNASWSSLVPKTAGVATNPVALCNLLATYLGTTSNPAFQKARLRMNGALNDNLNWIFAQYNLPDASPDSLDQQPATPGGPCVTSSTGLGQFIATNLADFAAFKQDYSHDPRVNTNTARIVDNSDPKMNLVLTLDKSVLPLSTSSDTLEATRFSASVYSCVGCHGFETEKGGNAARTVANISSFDQIRYREKGATSKLSPFLTGDPQDCGAPTTSLWPVTPLLACNATGVEKEFNDLVRRHLYSLVVAQDPSTWASSLKNYIAVQVH